MQEENSDSDPDPIGPIGDGRGASEHATDTAALPLADGRVPPRRTCCRLTNANSNRWQRSSVPRRSCSRGRGITLSSSLSWGTIWWRRPRDRVRVRVRVRVGIRNTVRVRVRVRVGVRFQVRVRPRVRVRARSYEVMAAEGA